MMKKNFILCLVISIGLFFVACDGKTSRQVSEDKEVVTVAEDDREMNAAIQKAKDKFSTFENAYLNNQDSVYQDFTVKLGFVLDDGGVEHMWLSDIIYDGKQFSGILANEPRGKINLKPGDKVDIDPKIISDWMYFDVKNAKTYGGYTIQVLIKDMPDAEKAEFLETNGFNFVDKI